MSVPLGESLDDLLTARAGSGRLGEHWPQGPTGATTEAVIAPTDYASWLREAQPADVDTAVLLRRVRRARVSRYARGPLPAPSAAVARAQRDRGRRVDTLLAGDDALEPLSWSDDSPSAATVDRIAGTGYLAGSPPVDLGRLLTALDGAFAGPSPHGLVAREASGLPAAALAGWLGDLAAWLLGWDRRRRESMGAGGAWTQADSDTALAEAQREQAPLEAMVGSFDGQVLGGWYEATVVGTFDADVLVSDTALRAGDVIERYYGNSLPPGTEPVPVPTVGDRFERFAQVSVPQLPAPADAAAAVAGDVLRAAATLLYLGRRGRWLEQGPLEAGERPAEDLATATAALAPHAGVADSIGDRFAALLSAGLGGQPFPPGWPRAT